MEIWCVCGKRPRLSHRKIWTVLEMWLREMECCRVLLLPTMQLLLWLFHLVCTPAEPEIIIGRLPTMHLLPKMQLLPIMQLLLWLFHLMCTPVWKYNPHCNYHTINTPVNHKGTTPSNPPEKGIYPLLSPFVTVGWQVKEALNCLPHL